MQGVGRQHGPVEVEAARKLGGQMLGIGGAAAIAAEIHAAAGLEAGDDFFDSPGDGRLEGFILFQKGKGIDVRPQAGGDYLFTVHVVSPSLLNSKSYTSPICRSMSACSTA